MKTALCTVHVAGIEHHDLPDRRHYGAASIARWSVSILESDSLVLVREPDNRFDPNAIMVAGVLEGFQAGNIKFGYIPKQTALWMAKLLDAGAVLTTHVEYADLSTGTIHVTVSKEEGKTP